MKSNAPYNDWLASYQLSFETSYIYDKTIDRLINKLTMHIYSRSSCAKLF